VAAFAAFIHFRLPGPPETPSSVPILAILALVAALFATLTVEVDEEAVRLRFGVGLLRKRIPLASVGAWEAVTRAKGLASPAAPGEGWSPLPRRGFGWVAVSVFAVPAALVGYAFWAQVQPPGVTVTAEGFAVDTPFYGRSFAAADVAALSLEQTLPRVLARTNGFAGAGALRGHFRVEGLGPGRLYVDAGFPPYVLVRLREGYVILNFREPERTRALYEEMARAWPDRVSAAAP
jgi:hypothetical protein